MSLLLGPVSPLLQRRCQDTGPQGGPCGYPIGSSLLIYASCLELLGKRFPWQPQGGSSYLLPWWIRSPHTSLCSRRLGTEGLCWGCLSGGPSCDLNTGRVGLGGDPMAPPKAGSGWSLGGAWLFRCGVEGGRGLGHPEPEAEAWAPQRVPCRSPRPRRRGPGRQEADEGQQPAPGLPAARAAPVRVPGAAELMAAPAASPAPTPPCHLLQRLCYCDDSSL